ncbi:hypothetical protein ACI6Q2_09500 [Chitinophagaceae bacterium LWZ2-11]
MEGLIIQEVALTTEEYAGLRRYYKNAVLIAYVWLFSVAIMGIMIIGVFTSGRLNPDIDGGKLILSSLVFMLCLFLLTYGTIKFFNVARSFKHDINEGRKTIVKGTLQTIAGKLGLPAVVNYSVSEKEFPVTIFMEKGNKYSYAANLKIGAIALLTEHIELHFSNAGKLLFQVKYPNIDKSSTIETIAIECGMLIQKRQVVTGIITELLIMCEQAYCRIGGGLYWIGTRQERQGYVPGQKAKLTVAIDEIGRRGQLFKIEIIKESEMF